MIRLATVLAAVALSVSAAACGDDEPGGETQGPAATGTGPPATDASPTGTTAALDEIDGGDPYDILASVTAIERRGGSDDPADMDAGFVVLTVEGGDGQVRRVVVPPDVSLDRTAERVLRDPSCAGRVQADLQLVDAPPTETEGDAVLVTADVVSESC